MKKNLAFATEERIEEHRSFARKDTKLSLQDHFSVQPVNDL